MISSFKKSLSLENIRAFYMGNIYPVLICFIVALGSISGLEFYFNILHTALACGAFWISKSIRPLMISFLTYVMQVSVKNSPFFPSYSDYYFSGWRLVFVIAIACAIVISLVAFVVKNRVYSKVSFNNTPCLLSLLLLSSAFLTNGLFSGQWKLGNIIFAFANIAVYLLIFLLFYHGFSEDERAEGISKYFAYISMLVSFVISAEIVAHFITADNVFIDGSINKVAMALGWGIWNLVGVSLSVLIPVIFYGMHVNKYPWLYFAAATLTYVMALLTMSRNALVFASLSYAVCVIISCFKGKNKCVFRIITVVGVALVIVLGVLAWDKIQELLRDYFERGFSDNGRYALWRAAFDNFLNAPIFGMGFYGFNVETDVFGPLAKQAHNTVLQLLSATGIVGFSAYAYYRFSAVKPIFKKPTFTKSMMAISIAVLLFGSLLDNFIFNIYPMFHYTMSLVIIHKSDNE